VTPAAPALFTGSIDWPSVVGAFPAMSLADKSAAPPGP